MEVELPIETDNLLSEEKDKQIVRGALMSELEAINQYEQMIASTDNDLIKKQLEDIIVEEKDHVAEFLRLLITLDTDQSDEIKDCMEEEPEEE